MWQFQQQCKGVWKQCLTISVLHCRTKICQFSTVLEWNFILSIVSAMKTCWLDTSAKLEQKRRSKKDCSATLTSITSHLSFDCHLNPSIFLSHPCWLSLLTIIKWSLVCLTRQLSWFVDWLSKSKLLISPCVLLIDCHWSQVLSSVARSCENDARLHS